MSFLYFLFFVSFILMVKSECQNGSVPTFTNSNLCYLFQSNATYYLEAEQVCRNFRGHLTSVHNIFDNMFLAQEALTTFTGSANNDFWFGINDLASKGKWIWMDNTTVDFTDWEKGQPQNITGSDCGAIVTDHGQWISDDCFKKKPYVCLLNETRNNPTTVLPTTTFKPKICPEAWSYFSETGFCYRVLINETWLNSGEQCKYARAELASLHLITESNFVAHLLNGTYEAWMGLYTKDNGTHWQWTDGTPFDLPNWDTNQPDGSGVENCGTIRHNGKMNNWVCSGVTKFVCKKLPS